MLATLWKTLFAMSNKNKKCKTATCSNDFLVLTESNTNYPKISYLFNGKTYVFMELLKYVRKRKALFGVPWQHQRKRERQRNVT